MSDLALLDSVLQAKKAEYPDDLNDGEVFELFSVDTLLKNYRLSFEEIEDGIVDGSADGGVDCFYIFVNKNLVSEDFDYKTFQEDVHIEIHIFQSKRETSFREEVLNNIQAHIDHFFNLDLDKTDLEEDFNPKLVEKLVLVREAFSSLIMTYPKLSVKIHYCCRAGLPTDRMIRKSETLCKIVTNRFTSADVRFSFYGAGSMYEAARKRISERVILETKGTPLREGEAYASLVNLNKYAEFLESDGDIADGFFEFNPRDYENDARVNKEMAKSLSLDDDVDFWWLNNGITIIADKVEQIAKGLLITNPLIVNGLQSSHEIYRSFSKANRSTEKSVLIRVIQEGRDKVRDRIVNATNSQTKLKKSSLRSTDEIQIRIEDYLRQRDIFYDRRKNYYKNRGISAAKIISIDRLSQAVCSVRLQRPETARGRPGDLMLDSNYDTIFNLSYDLGIYETCAKISFYVDRYWRKTRQTFDQSHRNELKHHTTMVLAWNLLGGANYDNSKLAKLSRRTILDEEIEASFRWTIAIFQSSDNWSAKDQSFTDELKGKWSAN